MEQNLEFNILTAENFQYESPSMEIIEMELEGPILQMSGEDSTRQDW